MERTKTLVYEKIYLSHFILERVAKGLMLVMCERWVGDGDRLLHIDPKFLFFLILAGLLNRESLRAQALCLELVLTPASCLQLELQLELELTQAVCGTWLYNCLTYTCFLWAYPSAPNSNLSTGQGDIPISSTGCTCFAFFCLFTQVHHY